MKESDGCDGDQAVFLGCPVSSSSVFRNIDKDASNSADLNES